MEKKKGSKRQSDKSETNNDQIKKSNPGDADPNKNEDARRNLNEHTRKDFDK